VRLRAAHALLLLPVLACVWPGDATWINDEPRIIAFARWANETGSIPVHGIMGSKGLAYGPFPVWFYSILLRFRPDLETLVVARAALSAACVAASLAWLASTLGGFSPAAIAAVLFSPYLWIYNRQLWDNNLLVPLSALVLAAYASFCAKPRAPALWTAVTGAALMFLTHPMGLALTVPITLHFILFHRGWARAHPGAVGWPCLAAALVTGPYLAYFLSHAGGALAAGESVSPWPGLLVPLGGGNYFSARGLDSFFGPGWPFVTGSRAAPVAAAAAWVSRAAVPATAIGAVVVAMRLWNRWNRGSRFTPAEHLGLVGLGAVVAQAALAVLARSYGHPHYFNATWCCYFLFLATALGSRFRRPAARLAAGLAAGVWAASLGIVMVAMVWTTHATGGNQFPQWGPALRTQVGVIARLGSWDPGSRVLLDAPNYRRFPDSFEVLKVLCARPGRGRRPVGDLVVRHASANPQIGWLVVEERNPSRR